MAEIDKTNLRSMARAIALELDKKDSCGKDGKIEASIWNKFVEDKGGKQIRESITLENAIKSITTYLAKNATKTGEAFGDLADKWFNKETTSPKDTTPIDETNPTEGTKPVKETTSPVKQTPVDEIPPLHETPPSAFKKIKKFGKNYSNYNIISDYRARAKVVLGNAEQGKKNAKGIIDYLNGNSKYVDSSESYKLNKDNVAYTLQSLFNSKMLKSNKKSQEVMWGLMSDLLKKADELKIPYDKTKIHGSSFDINNQETMSLVKKLVKQIITHNNTVVNDFNALKATQTPNKQNAGKTIVDKATGKKYVYDKNGYIDYVGRNRLTDCWLSRSNKGNFIINNKQGRVHYKQNGKVDSYLESTTINGKRTNIWRNANGCISQSFYDIDEGGEKIRFYYDDEGNAYKYVKEGDMYKHKSFGREEARSIDGTLLYYEERNELDNRTRFTYRDTSGNVMKYWEIVPRNKQVNDDIYYDKDGNVISEDEYNRIPPLV